MYFNGEILNQFSVLAPDRNMGYNNLASEEDGSVK